MKVRNGFVSNSSSSSFIITLPKDRNLRLSEIEDYLGGYSDELTDDQKDCLSFFLWKTIKDKSIEPEEPIEHHVECIATYNERRKLAEECRCTGECWWSEEHEPRPERCEGCKFLRLEDRPTRSDDYYEIRDNQWIENKSIISEDKNNYYITIDDNEPGDYIDFDTACNIRRVDPLFKDSSKVIELGG